MAADHHIQQHQPQPSQRQGQRSRKHHSGLKKPLSWAGDDGTDPGDKMTSNSLPALPVRTITTGAIRSILPTFSRNKTIIQSERFLKASCPALKSRSVLRRKPSAVI